MRRFQLAWKRNDNNGQVPIWHLQSDVRVLLPAVLLGTSGRTAPIDNPGSTMTRGRPSSGATARHRRVVTLGPAD
jgi:hypothetical protein